MATLYHSQLVFVNTFFRLRKWRLKSLEFKKPDGAQPIPPSSPS